MSDGTTTGGTLLNALRVALEPSGLNLVGVAAIHAYDAQVPAARSSNALLPGAKAIVVVANGGPALWRAFLLELRRNPHKLSAEQHPFDAFVARQVAAADGVWAQVRRRWFFASATEATQLDFRVLGHAAGLGSRSRLNLLLNSTYGTWLGLRAACFVDLALVADAPGGPDRCAGCAAPCITACPGSAFVDGVWDVDRCSAFHVESRRCHASCDARLACPEGRLWRYPPEEILYHYDRDAGRKWLRRYLGMDEEADRHVGIGPRWNDWRERIDVRGK